MLDVLNSVFISSSRIQSLQMMLIAHLPGTWHRLAALSPMQDIDQLSWVLSALNLTHADVQSWLSEVDHHS